MKRILSALLIALSLFIPHYVTGYTSVYLVNNTPFTFTLEMAQTRGTSLAAPYYEQLFKGPVTPYMRSTELYTFSRATNITWGETFDFAVIIRYDKDNFLAAYQSITGTATDSTMKQSMSGTNVTPVLGDSDVMGPRYTTWHLPFGDIQVTYERYFTGGSDDLQITLGYTHPSLEGADDPNTLNVLTYNLYMRPRAFLKNGQMERAALIPDYVRGFDAIIFQEAFDNDARKILLDALKDEYPHQTPVVQSDDRHPYPRTIPAATNGGVVIISKHPFKKQYINDESGHPTISSPYDEIIYKDCSADDCLAEKGAMYVIINKNGVPYHLFGTHTNAQPDTTAQEMRKNQFNQLREFIDSKKIPASERVLIGGDMNVDMTKFPQEYQQMLNILQVTHPKVVGVKDPDGNIYTADPKTNKLVGDKNPQEFLDYIFYENNHKKPTTSYNEVRPLKSSTGWKEYFFETEYFDLSDHYPVYGHFEYT